jgi:hypothetical protein
MSTFIISPESEHKSPEFPEAGTGPWRRLVLVKIEKVRGLLDVSESASEVEVSYINRLLSLSGKLIEPPQKEPGWSDRFRGWAARFRAWWTGDQCDQAWRYVHEAEAQAIALLPEDRRVTRMREFLADAPSILDPHDPVLDLKPCDRVNDDASPVKARELVTRYRAKWDDRYVRTRNYRNRLIIMISIVTLFLITFVMVGGAGLFSINQTTTSTSGTLSLVWPTWEPRLLHLVAMIAIGTIGSVGGLLAGARQITQMGGVYNPFYLPLYSLMLKIQMGALSALAGTLALLGGIAPEIRIGQWGDIAAWALIFGASQQFVTQLVDRKVHALISSEPRDSTEKK